MIIKKKAWSGDLFQKMMEGKKKFDLRLADFECNPGDILLLEEWDPKTREYTGRKIEKRVTFILKTKDLSFWSKEDVEKYGLQIISFE